MQKPWAVGVWLLGLCAALPAQALVEAAVVLQAPRIEVFDLNPGDGIPAAWAEDSSGWAVTFRHRYYFDLRDNIPPPEVEGDGSFSLGLGAVSGSAKSPDSRFFVGDALYPEQQTLRVTPYTRLTLSVPYRLDIVLQPEQGWGSRPPKVLASLELILLGLNNLRDDGSSGDRLFDELPYLRQYDELASPWAAPTPGSSFREGTLTLSFDNDSATDASFSFRAELVAFGATGDVAAVPEPASLAFWLAGGCLLAWRLRRRG